MEKKTSFKNVETLKRFGASACELAIELHKDAEDDQVLDVLIVARDPGGVLSLRHTPMDTCDVTEIATYLNAHAQMQVWKDNEAPRMLDEGDEECDED